MKNLMITIGLCVWLVSVSAWAETVSKDDDYFEPLEILTRNCAGCHQEPDHPGALFLNKAHLSEPETIKLMIRLIKTSQMPPAHAKFKNTSDGKKLLAWLEKEQAKKKPGKKAK